MPKTVSAHLEARESGQEPTGRGPETASARVFPPKDHPPR